MQMLVYVSKSTKSVMYLSCLSSDIIKGGKENDQVPLVMDNKPRSFLANVITNRVHSRFASANMADEDVVGEEHINDESDSKSKKSAKHDSGATDLEKITDHVEEVEINNRNISDVSLLPV